MTILEIILDQFANFVDFLVGDSGTCVSKLLHYDDSLDHAWKLLKCTGKLL